MKQSYNKRQSLKEALYNCYTNPSFEGRARRSEFWWNVLSFFIITAIIKNTEVFLADRNDVFSSILDFSLSIITLVMVYFQIAITFRRLHDTGRSGWWQEYYIMKLSSGLATPYIDYETASLLSFINYTAFFVVIAGFCSMDSMKETNKYGKSPKYNLEKLENI